MFSLQNHAGTKYFSRLGTCSQMYDGIIFSQCETMLTFLHQNNHLEDEYQYLGNALRTISGMLFQHKLEVNELLVKLFRKTK